METTSRRGFTLIEVLVVIGILAVLAALVFPVMSHAREAGRRTTCQSNLRQLAAAVQQYVQDSDGTFPPASQTRPVRGRPTLFSWQDCLGAYLHDRQVLRCVDHPVEIFGEENYTYNARSLNVFTPKHPMRGRYESHFPHPATTWLNVDAGLITPDGVYHFCRMASTSPCGRSFFGTTIHAGGGNYSFLDGHVRWLPPEAMADVDCQNGPLPDPFTD